MVEFTVVILTLLAEDYNGIQAAGNANLLNELKAPAGLLLVAGVFGLHAALTGQRIMQALSLTTLIYTTYALTRLFSMFTDGLPVSALVQAAVAEGLLAIACIALLSDLFVRRQEV